MVDDELGAAKHPVLFDNLHEIDTLNVFPGSFKRMGARWAWKGSSPFRLPQIMRGTSFAKDDVRVSQKTYLQSGFTRFVRDLYGCSTTSWRMPACGYFCGGNEFPRTPSFVTAIQRYA